MSSFFHNFNALFGDYVITFLLIAVGVFYTIRTRFVQVRCFREGWKRLFGSFSFKKGTGISSYQAFAISVAEQVGTGNIIGACSAILIGGPGAVFWMWIVAFFGFFTMYAEAVLEQQTRVKNEDGSFSGGPAYYIRLIGKGKVGKVMAIFFAFATIIALGVAGTMVQANSIVETCVQVLPIPPWILGLVLSMPVAFVLGGGAQRITSVAQKTVPFMAGLYIIGCLVVIGSRIQYLPQSLWLIVKYAFVPNAILGGGIGAALKVAISQGVKRGLFSNEAGLGSTPHAHALAQVKTPHEQGVVAMINVFVDTFVILSLTALTVINTLYTDGGILADGNAGALEITQMTQLAFAGVFGQQGANIFIAVCLLFFAYTSLLGWSLFAQINFEYLFGRKHVRYFFNRPILLCIYLGSVSANRFVWDLADFALLLMAVPNILALFLLKDRVGANTGF